MPDKNQHLNFTAIWQIDDDGDDYIMVLWSEESHAAEKVGWKLLVKRESDEQSLVIFSNCSLRRNSTHQVKLEKLMQMRYLVSCSDSNQREDFEFVIKPCLSYDLHLIPLHGDIGEDQPIRKTKLKPVIKSWSEIV